MVDFFQIFVTSGSTEIHIESKIWFGMDVSYIIKHAVRVSNPK